MFDRVHSFSCVAALAISLNEGDTGFGFSIEMHSLIGLLIS